MSCIILQGLSKTYNSNVVVDNISLEIRDEEFMVLVGPSGCGKTTTLRIVAGLDSATGGDVFIGDRRVNDVLPRDRDIAMVFQNYALYPHMTVADNLAFGLRMRKVAETEIRRRIDEAAGLLGIGAFLKRKPGALSGGQRQRVALGRALVREPAAFLMDEPLSNLDAKLRVQMRTEILRIHKRLRTTVLYVTHDQVEAMTMGDRIVVMKDGVVQQIDTPIAIYQRPANAFVASFVGSPPMNFLPCTLGREGERLVLRGTAFEIPIMGELRSAFGNVIAADLTLGVRPEDVTVSSDPTFRNGKPTLNAIVDVVELLGPEKHLVLATGDGTLTARVSSENQVRVGEHVVIGIDPKRIHAYNAATGLAYC